MAALSNPAPAAAVATSDDGNFQISLYQCVLHGRSKAGVPPVLLGQSALGAAATTADFVKLVLNIARRASAAASTAAAGAEAAGAAAFDIPVEKIGCGRWQKNFRMFAFQARKQGLTDATSAQLCSEYFGPERDKIVVVLGPGATPGIVYDPTKDPTFKKPKMRPGAPGGPPPMR